MSWAVVREHVTQQLVSEYSYSIYSDTGGSILVQKHKSTFREEVDAFMNSYIVTSVKLLKLQRQTRC